MADVKEAKKTVEAVAEIKTEATKKEIIRYVASADLKWFAGTVLGAIAAGVLTFAWWDVRAQDKADKVGVTAHIELEDHKKMQATTFAALSQKVEQNRQEAAATAREQSMKLDAMLFRFAIPNPSPTPTPPTPALAPTPVKDGGQ